MGRYTKHTVEYFPHDASASSRRTLSILFSKFGHEGNSAWWRLLEQLASHENHFIDIRTDEDFEFLADAMRFTPERLRVILNKIAALGAINAELYSQGCIWSDNFVKRLDTVYKTRKEPLPSKPSFIGKEMTFIGKETPFIDKRKEQSKAEQSRVEQSRVKKSKALHTPALLKSYFYSFKRNGDNGFIDGEWAKFSDKYPPETITDGKALIDKWFTNLKSKSGQKSSAGGKSDDGMAGMKVIDGKGDGMEGFTTI
jgi:hypothetical protein